MEKETGKNQFVGYQYVARKARIKYLSAPSLHEGEIPEEYYRQLLDNFTQIRELAAENRNLLKDVLYPILEHTENLLDEEQVENIRGFIERLFNTYSMDNLDAGMAARAADRLLIDAEKKGKLSYIIEELQTQVLVYYTLMNMCERLQGYSALREQYREKGLTAGKRLCAYLDKDKFAALPDEASKERVLVISRYISSLYEDKTPGSISSRMELQLVDQSLALAQDEFYRQQAPDYDWDYHVVRCYEYAGLSTECGCGACLTRDEALRICDYMQKLRLILSTQEAQEKYAIDLVELGMMESRARFYAGLIDKKTYIYQLVELYYQRDENNYDTRAEYGNLVLPIEYIIQLDPKRLRKKECDNLEFLYQTIAGYAAKIPNGGSLSYMMEYFSYLLGNFIELPGGTTFETMCLNCLAALHPPTFVHSVMVGELTKCLCRHLIRSNPEVLRGVAGYQTREEILAHEKEILEFAYHGGCCHDVGKLIFIDTIFIYGRDLTEDEFRTIKEHPAIGASLLKRNSSTRAYADIAMGHHRWYDDTDGYPKEFFTEKLPEKTLIDIVACADCLDAATDTIGRSYSQGITLEQFAEEVKGAAGTRYAPYVAKLFLQEEVLKDIRYLLGEGRRQQYYSTYAVLQKILYRNTNDLSDE